MTLMREYPAIRHVARLPPPFWILTFSRISSSLLLLTLSLFLIVIIINVVIVIIKVFGFIIISVKVVINIWFLMNVNLCCFIVPTCKMYENIVQRIEYLTKLLIHAVSLSAHFLIKLNIFIKSFEQILHFHFFLIGLESLSHTFNRVYFPILAWWWQSHERKIVRRIQRVQWALRCNFDSSDFCVKQCNGIAQ